MQIRDILEMELWPQLDAASQAKGFQQAPQVVEEVPQVVPHAMEGVPRGYKNKVIEKRVFVSSRMDSRESGQRYGSYLT